MLDEICRERIEKIIFAHLLIKYIQQMLQEGGYDVGGCS